MARFLLGDEWFDPLSSTALYESEYERLLLSNARALFPDYYVVEFKPIIQSEYGTAKPDLALVDRELRLWWVVEVELAHHPLKGHVLPQVEILTSGHYTASEAELLTQSIPEMDSEVASDLVKGAQPPVLVIVNQARPGWHEAITQLGASLMIAEVFRSGRNAHAIRANGTYPTIAGDFVSDCALDRSLPGLLVVQSPATLDVHLRALALRLKSPAPSPSGHGSTCRIKSGSNHTAGTHWKAAGDHFDCHATRKIDYF